MGTGAIMPSTRANDQIEDMYGSIENFAEVLYFDYPEVLSGDKGVIDAAAELGVDPRTLDYFLRKSTAFRAMLRSMLTNDIFDIYSESEHLKAVAGIATNRGRTVATPSGKVVEVSNTEKAVMDAGEYLNSYRGTPLKGEAAKNAATVNITFGGAPVVDPYAERTLDATGQPSRSGRPTAGNDGKASEEGRPRAHRPLTAATPPPSGTQKRYSRQIQQALSGADGADTGLRDTDVGADFDFVSDRAEQREEDRLDSQEVEPVEPSDARFDPGTGPEQSGSRLEMMRSRLQRAHSGHSEASDGE